MSNLFTLPSQRVTDANTDALAGAKLYFYDPGTTDDRTVYSNRTLATPHAQPVVADAGGLFAPIYLPTGTYKVVLKDADDVTIFTADNVDGPLDTSTFLQDGDLVLDSPVVPKTTTYTVVAGDKGKIINANPTGGSFTITLLSAVTAGDGFPLTIRHVGTANQVTIEATTGQTIDGRAGISLTDQYQSITLTSDGANWHIVSDAPKFKETAPYFTVQDRLTAPPTSPTPGACYIINGTPTGAWSSYANKDLVIATGTGSWAKFTPATGWKAWIVDEDVESVFYDSAWTDYSNVTAPTTSALKIAVFSDEKAQNTQGGTPTANAWTKHDLQTERSNTITGASLASSVITLPTGKYMIHAQVSFYASLESQIRLRNTTDSSTIAISPQMYGANYTSGTGPASILASAGTVALGYVDVTEATETIELQYYVTTNPSSGLGRVRNVSSENEVYAVVTILDLTSIQGPTGEQGTQGNDGLDAAFDYQWNTATSGDPGSGKMLLNHATFSSVTQINISETTNSGASIADVLATWDDSTSSVRGQIKFSKEGTPGTYRALNITGAGTDQGTYWTFPVTPVDDNGALSSNDDLAVIHVRTGDKGDTGSTGPTGATSFTFSTTTTDSNPGSGYLRLNHATPASATAMYVDNANRGGSTISSWLDTIDDLGASTGRGTLTLMDATNPSTVFAIYTVTGSVVDGTGYRKITLTYVSGAGSFTNGNEVLLSFSQRGADGTPGGSTTELQFNAAGAFEGASGTAWDDTNRTLTITGPTLSTSAAILQLAQTWAGADSTVKFTGLSFAVSADDSTSNIYSKLALIGSSGSSTTLENGYLHVLKGGQIVLANGTDVGTATSLGGMTLTGTAGEMALTSLLDPNTGLPAQVVRFYWENSASVGSHASSAAVIRGMGQNRLSLESAAAMILMSDTGHFEIEGALGSTELEIVGYKRGSAEGQTINFMNNGHQSGSRYVPAAFTNYYASLHIVDFRDAIDGSAGVVSYIDTLGGFVGPSADLTAVGATDVPLTVKGASAHSGHLTDWRDSSGNLLAYVSPATSQRFSIVNGVLRIMDAAESAGFAFYRSGNDIDLYDYGGSARVGIKAAWTQWSSATAASGYITGAGGAVTQGTSRTTGVTLNKPCGAITLVSAAGSTTPATFTVTNSLVAATDTIIVSQKSGTDDYIVAVTAVAAGSFDVTFYTTGGTTTEQPVFNFVIVKAVTS